MPFKLYTCYEGLVEKLRSLGAEIEKIDDGLPEEVLAENCK